MVQRADAKFQAIRITIVIDPISEAVKITIACGVLQTVGMLFENSSIPLNK